MKGELPANNKSVSLGDRKSPAPVADAAKGNIEVVAAAVVVDDIDCEDADAVDEGTTC